MSIDWAERVERHDITAAVSYLALVTDRVREPVDWDTAPMVVHPAKDILRASGLPLLPPDNVHVKRDLWKIRHNGQLSPVILVQGVLGTHPLIIADGYHRVCAAYHHNENADIPALFLT